MEPTERRQGVREIEIQVATLTVQVAAMQKTLDDINDPEHGKFTHINQKLDELIALRQRTEGAVAFMKVLSVVVTSGAAAWLWIAAHLNVSPK